MGLAAIAVAAVIAGQDVPTAAEMEAILASMQPELEALSALSLALGACERHMDGDDVTWFLDEFVAVDFALSNIPLMLTANVAASGYVKGRAEAREMALTHSECERLIPTLQADYAEALSSPRP